MRQTLADTLKAVFGSAPSFNAPTADSSSAARPSNDLIQAAIKAYEQGEKALQASNWSAYGQSRQRLGELLQQLDGSPK